MREKTLGKRACVCVCLAAALMTGGCGTRTQEEEPHMMVENSDGTMEYNFVVAQVGDIEVTKNVSCTYRQQQDQVVSFGIVGRRVTEVYVEEGDQVKKGTLLVELDASDLERQIEDLEYRIARNELLLKNANENEELDISQAWVNHWYNHFGDAESTKENVEMIKKGYRYQKEDYEDALEFDKVQLEKFQQELSGCRIYAQIDGVVYKPNQNLKGSTSKEDTPVMTIVDNSQCLFEMENPEYAQYFTEGEAVPMKVISGAAAGEYLLLPYDMEHWGDVQQFGVLDGPMTTGIEVGTKGTLQFVMDRRSQVLTLPREAIRSADDKSYVYVTDEDNMRQIRWVETGLANDTTVEILSGLEEGERVVRR